MPSWQGKSKGKPWGYRIFVSILKVGGVKPAYLLLRFVSLHYLVFSFKTTKSTFIYFHKYLGYGFFKSVINTYKNYNLLGQSIIDKVVLMSGIPNKFTFKSEGRQNLEDIAAMGQGGLLLSAHIGSWEIAGHLLGTVSTIINIVIFDGEKEAIKDYMASVTGKSIVNFIVIKNNLSHIFQIHEALSKNQLVCMHADRYLEGNKTLTTSFLSADAKFPLGPFLLASKLKVPVVFVFAVKESNYHYHFFASEIKDYLHLSKDDAIYQILADFVKEMEQKVKQYPAQWYNYYNFWQ